MTFTLVYPPVFESAQLGSEHDFHAQLDLINMNVDG